MKITPRIFCLFLLCIVSLKLKAQKVSSLSIGDTCSSAESFSIINFPKSLIRLSDFRGKALILDFWAPWCVPCIKMFPQLDSLQKKYSTEIKILLVTQDSKDFSSRLLNNLASSKKIDLLPSIVDDTVLAKLFKHITIPHYVLLDKNGVVKAIVNSENITDQNIEALIAGKELNVPVKNDKTLKYNESKPIFGAQQINYSDQLIFQSVLTKYMPEAPAGANVGKYWVNCNKCTISQMYKLAFGNFQLEFLDKGRLKLEGFASQQDSLLIGCTSEQSLPLWRKIRSNFYFNYELVVPSDTPFDKKDIFLLMQQDLNKFFYLRGIQGRREKRAEKILALKRISDTDNIHTKGGASKEVVSKYYVNIRNLPMSFFISKLQAYFPNETGLPIVDQTQYKGRIDIEINADLTNIEDVNRELNRYDLKLVETVSDIDMIIIEKIKPK